MSEPTTPLMQQYNSVKSRYPHALLLFRLGDFYELFYEDAIIAARELQITLTSRNREKGQPIPMCGVPYHAADGYIAKLIRAGFKVAICEQMEQPGPGKKLVRREVSRVITPGTATDISVLDARENNFLAAASHNPTLSVIGLALVDLSTGEFLATEFVGNHAEESLRDELQLLRPRETLLPRPQQLFETAKVSLLDGAGGVESRLEDWIFQRDYAERILREQFGVAELTGFGLDDHPQAQSAAGAIIHYLRENAARGDDAPSVEALRHLDRIRYYEQHDTLVLDPVSVRNLELLSPIFTEESKSAGPTTLIAALDSTVTGMGARPAFLDSSPPDRSRRHRRSPRRRRTSPQADRRPRRNSQGTPWHSGSRAPHQPHHSRPRHSPRTPRPPQVPRATPHPQKFSHSASIRRQRSHSRPPR